MCHLSLSTSFSFIFPSLLSSTSFLRPLHSHHRHLLLLLQYLLLLLQPYIFYFNCLFGLIFYFIFFVQPLELGPVKISLEEYPLFARRPFCLPNYTKSRIKSKKLLRKCMMISICVHKCLGFIISKTKLKSIYLYKIKNKIRLQLT